MVRLRDLVYFFFSAFLLNSARCEDSFEDEEGEDDVGSVIGIDLGTTYSAVGIYRNGKVEIIANEQGERITPSYVAFTDDERLVGESAKNQIGFNPSNTVFSAKRLIGRSFKDKTVQNDIKLLPYKVTNQDGRPKITVEYKKEKKSFSPKEISAMVLGKMKAVAENYLGEKVTHAVITVPAYFNDAQRKATKEAGAIAGLNVMRIINEPTAAAIAYGIDKKSNKETNVLVYDLGGGTFDVSILTVDGGVFEVKATNGNTHLGGEDFDLNLARHFVKGFKKKHDIDLSKDKKAFAKLKKKCEDAKRTLSSAVKTTVLIENIVKGIDFKETVTRAQFENLSMRLFKDTLKPVKTVIRDSKLSKSEIDEVVLVGGSTRIPIVQKLLQNFFEGKKLNKDINPDEAVAYGAAVQGFILSGKSDDETKDMVLLDVTPLSLGIETVGGMHSKVITKNTPIPTVKSQTFTTNDNGQTKVDISVFQGEARMTKFNHKLGRFTLDDIEKAPRGVPQIDVSFDIDANGILTVSAKDKATGKNKDLKIDESMSNSDEVKKMKENFEQYQQEDEKLFNQTQAKNKLTSTMHAAEDYLTKAKDLPSEDKDDLTKLIAETKEWNEKAEAATNEVGDFDEKRKELEEVMKEIQSGEGAKSDEGEEEGEEEEEDDNDEEEDEEENSSNKDEL